MVSNKALFHIEYETGYVISFLSETRKYLLYGYILAVALLYDELSYSTQSLDSMGRDRTSQKEVWKDFSKEISF